MSLQSVAFGSGDLEHEDRGHMYYTQKSQSSGRTVGIVVVLAFHAALAAALLYIKRDEVVKILEPITTEIIEKPDLPEEEPPPPPPVDEIDLAPPPDQVILPEFTFDTPAATAITQIEGAKDPVVKPQPAPPAKPAPKPAVKGTCNLPKRIEKPPYPSRSERLDEEGVTTMRVCVTAKGRASEAVVTEGSGFPDLDAAAVKWALGLRNMQPATVDGKPVDGCCMVVPLQWEIEER
jgi:periplasmic protein TonB